MAQNVYSKRDNGAKPQSGRRPRKNFPLMSFEDTLILPQGILDYGVNGEINRLTLLDKIQWKPSSSKTRVLISSSSRYGLTKGNYSSTALLLTDRWQDLLNANSPSRKAKKTQFHLAIAQFEPFNKLYEKLKGRHVPDEAVLKDEFGHLGVAQSDRVKAAEVFVKNLQFFGLLHEISGRDFVRGIEEVTMVESDPPVNHDADSPAREVAPIEEKGNTAVATTPPALHIDIQVHIDPTSNAEQIDLIFASMARHLYGLES